LKNCGNCRFLALPLVLLNLERFNSWPYASKGKVMNEKYRVVFVKGPNTTPLHIKKMDEVIKSVNPKYFSDVNDQLLHCEEPDTAIQVIFPDDDVALFDFSEAVQ